MHISDRNLCRSATDLLVLFNHFSTGIRGGLTLLGHHLSEELRQHRDVAMPLLIPHAKVRYDDDNPVEIVGQYRTIRG